MKDWIKTILNAFNRNTIFIHFSFHIELKNLTRNLDLDNVFKTVRKGKVLEAKSIYPDRIAFYHFFKEGFTYVAIVKIYPNSFKVITAWKNKGRKI